MWTHENGARYDRSQLRYPSDLSEEEWALVAPPIPPAKRGGGKRRVALRAVVNGLLSVLSRGCQWRAIPKDLPPRSTVYDDFDLWDDDGTLEHRHHALYVACREQVGRAASQSTLLVVGAVLDESAVTDGHGLADSAATLAGTAGGHRSGTAAQFLNAVPTPVRLGDSIRSSA